jgi:predicted nucleic acid-binding protein
VILLDTSGLLAALDESQRRHRECAAALGAAVPPRLLSPFVLAELDYLLMRYVGNHAQCALLDEVARGVYRLEQFDGTDMERAREVLQKYTDLAIGLADASLVVLAERHSVASVLTLDRRHFSALRFSRRRRFEILP